MRLYVNTGTLKAAISRAPPVGFEPETNGFQFYAIANLYCWTTSNIL